MTDHARDTWQPHTTNVADPETLDELRHRCPVAHSDATGWTLFRHEDVERVIQDADTFSNMVSRHLSVPNGMDAPEHGAYREVIRPYFSAAAVAGVEPAIRTIAVELADALEGQQQAELISAFCEPFAARAQCAFMGWPASLGTHLADWARRNQRAIHHRDRAALKRIAEEFGELVTGLLEERRQAGADAPDDNTTRLMRETVDGRALEDREIVSILRNWTMGEVGSLSAALGIISAFLAERPDVQTRLRDEPAAIPDALEEILRLHGPLFSNRRRTTRAVELGGQHIPADSPITVIWGAANRDAAAFEAATEFRPERDQSASLLWGAGTHVCPGAPLARAELRIAVHALLAATALAPHAHRSPTYAAYPACGFDTLPLALTAGRETQSPLSGN